MGFKFVFCSKEMKEIQTIKIAVKALIMLLVFYFKIMPFLSFLACKTLRVIVTLFFSYFFPIFLF